MNPDQERVGMLVLSTTWGGAETVVLQLLSRLEARGMSTALFINDELLPHFTTLTGTAIYPLGRLEAHRTLTHAYRTARIHGRLRKAIAASHISVLHAHLERSLFALAAGVRRQQVPVIFTLHGGDSAHYKAPETAEHRAMRTMLRRMLRDQPQYTVTSCARWQLTQFEPAFRPHIRFIPNGVDTGLFTPAKDAKGSAGKTRKGVVLFVGRYAEQKGIASLRGAAERLPQYTFWCAGRGPLAPLLDLPNMKDLGFKTSAQLATLFAKATVCAFPSLYEALPLVGLEAMASGKAIVATPLGFTEYLEDGKNGLVVPVGDPERLARAIERLMKDPKRRARMEKAARETALRYEWEDVMDEYVKLYVSTAAAWRALKGGRRHG